MLEEFELLKVIRKWSSLTCTYLFLTIGSPRCPNTPLASSFIASSKCRRAFPLVRPMTRCILDRQNTLPQPTTSAMSVLPLEDSLPLEPYSGKGSMGLGTSKQSNAVPQALVFLGVQQDVGILYVVAGEAKSRVLRRALTRACLSLCCTESSALFPQNKQPQSTKVTAESLSSPCPRLLVPFPLSFFLIHSL